MAARNLAPSRKKRGLNGEDINVATPVPFNLGSDASDNHAGSITPVVTNNEEYPEETRSVVSISNHMEQLGRDTADSDQTIVAPVNTSLSIGENANTTGTSSTLDARIAALSDMHAEDRIAQLAQDAVANVPAEVPMEAEFLNDTDEEATTENVNTGVTTTTVHGDDSEMPDLEGSDEDC